jgi:hypothetical protein
MPARWSLTARLAGAVFCLVAAGGGAITAATHVVARDYLTRQADRQLRAYAAQLTSRPFTLFPGIQSAPGASGLGTSGLGTTGSALSVAVLSAGGQKLIIAGLATPPAARGGWLEVSKPVSYQAKHIPFVYGADDSSFSVTSKTRSGYAGTLVVGLNLAGVGRTVSGLTVTSLRVTGLAALLATAAAAGIARLLLRPVTEVGNTEAAAGDVSERASTAVAETCRQMRRPLSVLAGLAEYHRERGVLADDEAERMLRQVADEVSHLAALVDELGIGGTASRTARGEKRWTAVEGHDRLTW